MREVGRIHDKVLAHLTDHRIEDLLIGLASDVDVAGLEVLAWQFAEWKVLAFTVNVKFLIHTVHHVGNPTGAGLEKTHSQSWKDIEDTVQDHTGQLNHLRDRMLERVNHRHGLQEIKTETTAHCAVNR